jgi:hypothetical protein
MRLSLISLPVTVPSGSGGPAVQALAPASPVSGKFTALSDRLPRLNYDRLRACRELVGAAATFATAVISRTTPVSTVRRERLAQARSGETARSLGPILDVPQRARRDQPKGSRYRPTTACRRQACGIDFSRSALRLAAEAWALRKCRLRPARAGSIPGQAPGRPRLRVVTPLFHAERDRTAKSSASSPGAPVKRWRGSNRSAGSPMPQLSLQANRFAPARRGDHLAFVRRHGVAQSVVDRREFSLRPAAAGRRRMARRRGCGRSSRPSSTAS